MINNPPRSRFLLTEFFRQEPLIAFVSRTHPLARKRKLTVAALARTPLIIRDGRVSHGTTERILQDLRKHGISPKIAMRCDSPHAVKEAVRQNLGMGILFKSAVKADIRQGEFKRINLDGLELVGETHIVYRKDKPLSPAAKNFIELLREEKRTSSDPLDK